MKSTIKRGLAVSLLLAMVGLGELSFCSNIASATEAGEQAVVDSTGCPNAAGWYVNNDEDGTGGPDQRPTQKLDGWLFEDKDLIHHAVAPLDLADVPAGAFTADGTADKVVFKMETTAPYSTIVQTPDGKFWSSKVPSGKGSQGQPVAHVKDLLDADVIETPGKEYTGASKVVTFGVGYWTETSSTLVKSISFHGDVYAMSCPPVQSSSPSASASTSTSASPSASASTSASASHSVSPSASHSSSPAGGVGFTNMPPTKGVLTGGGLPLTGPSLSLFIAFGLAVVGTGVALTILARRRKVNIEA